MSRRIRTPSKVYFPGAGTWDSPKAQPQPQLLNQALPEPQPVQQTPSSSEATIFSVEEEGNSPFLPDFDDNLLDFQDAGILSGDENVRLESESSDDESSVVSVENYSDDDTDDSDGVDDAFESTNSGHTDDLLFSSDWDPSKFISGDYSPFKNFTETTISLLHAKHKMKKRLYDDLIKLLNHPDLHVEQLPGSYTSLQALRKSTPPINTHKFKVETEKGKTRNCYMFQVTQVLELMLSNPKTKDLREDTPIKSSTASEIFHGRLAREHPLFNKLSPLKQDSYTYSIGNHVLFLTQDQHQRFGRIKSFFKKDPKGEQTYAEIEIFLTADQAGIEPQGFPILYASQVIADVAVEKFIHPVTVHNSKE